MISIIISVAEKAHLELLMFVKLIVRYCNSCCVCVFVLVQFAVLFLLFFFCFFLKRIASHTLSNSLCYY